MPDLNCMINKSDADLGKVVSGWEYDGDGQIIFTTAAQNPDRMHSQIIEELTRRNLPMTALVPGNSLTIAGITFGGQPLSDGDSVTIAGFTPDGSAVSGTYAFAVGDTVADLIAKIQEEFDAAEAGAVTVTIAGGALKVTDVVGLTGTATACTLTFVDATPTENSWVLPVFAETTAGVTAAAAVKATAALAFTGVGVDTQTFTVNNRTYTLLTTIVAKATAALAFTGVGVDTQTFTVNDKTYTLLTTIVAKATATLDFAGVGVDTQTFTVNDQTYTLVTIMVDVAGNILIGADQTETCTNIVSAIMGTAGAGTTYGTGTVAPTGVNSAVRVADTVVFTATANGTAANSFATTETCLNASFTNGATMTGGVDDTADTILIGADQTATCNNIVSAVMGTAGAGSTYGTGSAAPTGVDTAVRSSTTVTFTATANGTAANSFASTETCDNASFTNGATFTGGVDDTADTILIGADQTATCNNIVSAVMGTAGAGSTYGTGSAAPTGVDTAVRSSTTVTFTATTAGTAANSFASTETCDNASFTNGATFTGGAAAVSAVLNVITGSPDLKVATVDATGASLIQAIDAVVGTLDPAQA